jgi:hypothetical protein
MLKSCALLASVGLAAAVPWDPKTGTTMNGQYHFANEKAGEKPQHRGTDYFEAVSPSYFSTYAQVNWDSHTVPLDAATVKALDGKLVNFVGYEFDMVRTLKNGTHVSVPAWELYNHHYGNTILGKGTKLVKTGVPFDHEGMAEGHTDEHLFPGYKFVNAGTEDGIRAAAPALSAGGLIIGNGAESRKTFHYFGEGYGVQVFSPNAAAMHPMIIDTKNREGGGTPQRPTGHGIVPNASTVGPDQMYSPIHECPCTDKWTKHISSFSTLKEGSCAPAITDPATCFGAAAELGLHPVTKNATISNPKLPAGCSVSAISGGYEINYNTDAKPVVQCGAPPAGAAGKVLNYTCDLAGQWMDIKSKGIFDVKATGVKNQFAFALGGKPAATVTVLAPTAADPEGTVSGMWGKAVIPGNMVTYSAKGAPACSQIMWANSADFVKMPFANEKPVPPVAARVAGMAENLVNITLDIDPSKDLVTLTLQGPANVWFGAGFGYHHVSTGGADPSVGVSMVGTNWSVVVFPNGTVEERDLGNHEPGVKLPTTVNIVSATKENGLHTVVMTRSIQGQKSDNYFFDPNANAVTFINAIGGSADFYFHTAKQSGVLYLVELDYPTCICDMAADQGTIGGYSWGTQRCVDKPLGQMLDDPAWLTGPYANNVKGKGVNPTCDIHAYRGGLRCCKGGTIILDEGQNVTNNDVFEWQLKYRYYYEIVEDPKTTQNTFMTSWWTEHNNGEHDIPVCLESDKSKCQNTITSNFTAGMMGGCANGCEFITMEGHCHIGCIGMEMWIMDDPANPVLLCNATVGYGSGDDWMDEMGYIAGANTCIFSKNDPNLANPVALHPLTKLKSVKISNNTNSYTGDMGLWEINMVPTAADHKWE